MARRLNRCARAPTARWSWRESNPRPNKEHVRFLHAYPGLDFRPMARPEPPTTGLSAIVSPLSRSRRGLSSIFLHRCVRTPRRAGNGAMSRFSTLCRNRLIYCTSIKQRERKKFRQLLFRLRDYRAAGARSACLHTHSTCCQNQTAPWVCLSVREARHPP